MVGLGLVAMLAILPHVLVRRERSRQFVPGELGREPASPLAADRAALSPRAYLTRALGVTERVEGGAEWAECNRLTPRLAFSHNLSRIFPPSLQAEHPEFFPLESGRRLMPPAGAGWWNPDLGRTDVAEWAADAARDYFAANPAAVSFAVGVNDGLVFGESSETLAAVSPLRWFRERPDYSDLVFGFTNRVADAVARTAPNKYVGALAYYWAENAPRFPLHPNVIPFLTADRSQGYDREFWQEERALQRRWAAAPRAMTPAPPPPRAGLYDYLYGHGFLTPRTHTRLIAEHLRHARRAGFTDYYAEMNPNWGLDGPMPWLVAQLLQDPEQSPEVLLDEYYRRYFRAAAGPMRRFFERCERQWMHQPGPAYWLKHYRNESQAALFPPATCGELRGLLAEAERRVAGDEIGRRRVLLVSAAFGVTERLVALSETRIALNRAAFADQTPWRRLLALAERAAVAKREFTSFTQRLRRESPLAIAAFNDEDYVRHEPVANAVIEIHRRAKAAGELTEAETALADAELGEGGLVWRALAGPEGRAQLRDGALAGELQRPRRIAGLDYGVALPADWLSSVEPAEGQQAVFDGERTLRLTRNKETSIYQWNAVTMAGLHVASVRVRGRVSPGNVVNLTLGWLDEAQKRVGLEVQRLPDGEWPEWVTLRVARVPPPRARWVGVSVRLQNQLPGDWVEVWDFSLVARE